MNEEVKKLWTDALRGEFKDKQGKGRLRTLDDHYCCLGVLCELHRRAHNLGVEEWRKLSTTSIWYKGESVQLPLEVRTWAELTYANPAIKDGDGTTNLADLNDGTIADHSFEEIADIIEKNL
jgi:hypothetical protein